MKGYNGVNKATAEAVRLVHQATHGSPDQHAAAIESLADLGLVVTVTYTAARTVWTFKSGGDEDPPQ